MTIRHRARIRFAKTGDLRLLGHRDLVRALERLFRRADLKLGMSEGFHPRPRMSFPSALSVGTAGLDEVMELEMAEHYNASDLLGRLAHHAIPGINFKSVEMLAENEAKLKVESVWFEFPVPDERRADVSERIEQFLATESYLVERPKRQTLVDIRPDVLQLVLDDQLRMHLAVSHQATVRPVDLIEVLGLADLKSEGHHLTRTTVQLQEKES